MAGQAAALDERRRRSGRRTQQRRPVDEKRLGGAEQSPGGLPGCQRVSSARPLRALTSTKTRIAATDHQVDLANRRAHVAGDKPEPIRRSRQARRLA